MTTVIGRNLSTTEATNGRVCGRVGWLDKMKCVEGFLKKYAGVERVGDLPDRKRASAIIEALKAIHRREVEVNRKLCEVG